MFRISVLFAFLAIMAMMSPALNAATTPRGVAPTNRGGSGNLGAEAIFDKMIHYESDQLAKVPSTNDYRCKLTETTARPGSTAREVTEKTLYFMVPMFQLQTVPTPPPDTSMGPTDTPRSSNPEEPVFYSDQDLMLVLRDSMDLSKERDQVVGDVPCYVISLTPKDPVYKAYSRMYMVAKDDFRHVQTVSHHASDTADNLTTQIDYTYGTYEGFKLLQHTVAETRTDKGAAVATTTAEYTDYTFNVGLTEDFFVQAVGNRTPHIPQS